MYFLLDVSVKAYIMIECEPLPEELRPGAAVCCARDRTRLRLLNLMDGQEVCVCYFVEILGQSQPKISRHLAYLRRAGVVAARREGKWMHYKIVVPTHAGAARILSETLSVLSEDKTMQADLSRLTKVCCAPKKSSGT